jgi:hypothetical protein
VESTGGTWPRFLRSIYAGSLQTGIPSEGRPQLTPSPRLGPFLFEIPHMDESQVEMITRMGQDILLFFKRNKS